MRATLHATCWGVGAEPVTAPTHAAVNGFIAAHAAAFAEDTLAVVSRARLAGAMARATARAADHANADPHLASPHI